MKTAPSIGEYLIQRLYAHGVRHVFGIPGDYVLGFYDQLLRSKLRIINTCDEQGAGFAADAYARVRGLGAVCITYCVGGLKVANPTAEAFAEKSPVVVISGAPGMREREKNPLLHHKVKEFDTQKKVFEQLTIASAVLSDPQTAFQEIDRVLHAALRFKRPVYIELPRDMVSVAGNPHYKTAELHERSDPKTLRAALAEAEQRMLTRIPEVSASVVSKIPRMENAARIILFSRKNFDGSGFPQQACDGQDIPIGARILRVLNDLAQLESSGLSRAEALERMKERVGHYDPQVVDTVVSVLAPQPNPSPLKASEGLAISADELREEQTLRAAVRGSDGSILVPAGTRVTPFLIESLSNLARMQQIREPLFVEQPMTA